MHFSSAVQIMQTHVCNEQVNHLITFTKVLLPLPLKSWSLSLVDPKKAQWTDFQVAKAEKKSIWKNVVLCWHTDLRYEGNRTIQNEVVIILPIFLMVGRDTIDQSPRVCGVYEKVVLWTIFSRLTGFWNFSYLASANTVNIIRATAGVP